MADTAVFREIESAWGVALPTRFGELFDSPDWNAVRQSDGSIVRVNLPVLTPRQILAAHRVQSEWELPDRFVPIAGDFHELIGLDYSAGSPRFAAVTDDRTLTELFSNFDAFLAGRILVDDDLGDGSGIVEAWLDF